MFEKIFEKYSVALTIEKQDKSKLFCNAISKTERDTVFNTVDSNYIPIKKPVYLVKYKEIKNISIDKGDCIIEVNKRKLPKPLIIENIKDFYFKDNEPFLIMLVCKTELPQGYKRDRYKR